MGCNEKVISPVIVGKGFLIYISKGRMTESIRCDEYVNREIFIVFVLKVLFFYLTSFTFPRHVPSRR